MNGSDHRVVASYLELYEEGEVKHINGPTHPSCREWLQLRIQKTEVGGSIVGFVFIQKIFFTTKSCSTERTGQTLLIFSTSPSSYLHGLSHL